MYKYIGGFSKIFVSKMILILKEKRSFCWAPLYLNVNNMQNKTNKKFIKLKNQLLIYFCWRAI